MATVTGNAVASEKIRIRLKAYDHVVLSLGVRPNPEVLSTFEDCANEVIYIGDCNTRIGTLYNAVHTAHEAASVL